MYMPLYSNIWNVLLLNWVMNKLSAWGTGKASMLSQVNDSSSQQRLSSIYITPMMLKRDRMLFDID